jgi:hypothetical protein
MSWSGTASFQKRFLSVSGTLVASTHFGALTGKRERKGQGLRIRIMRQSLKTFVSGDVASSASLFAVS